MVESPELPVDVVVVTFDRLPAEGDIDGDDCRIACELLDLHAAAWENCCAQDPVEAASWMRSFVPRGDRPEFLKQLQTIDVDVSGPIANALIAETVLTDNPEPQLTSILRELTEEGRTRRLTWYHIATPQPRTVELSAAAALQQPAAGSAAADEAVARFLRALVERALSQTGVVSERCAYVITARRGIGRPVARPFDSPACASSVTVPLWILKPQRTAVRIQQLCGTRDVGPTVLGLLSGRSQFPDTTEGGEDPAETLDLAPWIDHPGVILPRRIEIAGDGFRAVRTPDFLAVQEVIASESERDDGAAHDSVVRLYAQPEDPHCVNNIATAHETIVDAIFADTRP